MARPRNHIVNNETRAFWGYFAKATIGLNVILFFFAPKVLPKARIQYHGIIKRHRKVIEVYLSEYDFSLFNQR